MTGIATEIRWQVAQQGLDRLQVAVAMRRAPDWRESVLGERAYTYPELNDLLPTTVWAELKEWMNATEGYSRGWHVGGTADEDYVAAWGQGLGALLVTGVVGRRLHRIVHTAGTAISRPSVRLLFALRGAVARRLPVETMHWPDAIVSGPVSTHPGLSILREAATSPEVSPPTGMPSTRIQLAGVTLPGHAEAEDWGRLVTSIDGVARDPVDQEPTPMRVGTAEPFATPHDALAAVSGQGADLTVLWGHGMRRCDKEETAWSSHDMGASAFQITDALRRTGGAAIVAMCYSATEADDGSPSTVDSLSMAGLPLVIGFCGEPVSMDITTLVSMFVRKLAERHDLQGLERWEAALHDVRNHGAYAAGAARQLVATVIPHLTAGRVLYPLPPLDIPAPSGPLTLTAYRTAGQLLITKLADERQVRVPLPVEPLEFTLKLHDDEVALSDGTDGLQQALVDVVRTWPDLQGMRVRVPPTSPPRSWGLRSAMVEAVVEGLERLIGSVRPDSVDRVIHLHRMSDWGTPSCLALISIEDGSTVCRLGPVPAALRVREVRGRFPMPERLPAGFRLPEQPLVDWACVHRAAAGDLTAIAALVELQRAAIAFTLKYDFNHAYLQSVPERYGLALPAITELEVQGSAGLV